MSCSVFDQSTSTKKLNKGYVDKTSSPRNVLDFRFIAREVIYIMKPPSDLYFYVFTVSFCPCTSFNKIDIILNYLTNRNDH